MAFVVEQDEAFDPLHIGFFRTDRVMLDADSIAHLIQKLFRFHGKSPSKGLDAWVRSGGAPFLPD